jgi:uncharacterized RDD family membrane protein YckC
MHKNLFKEDIIMKLSAPKQVVFCISVILIIIGLLCMLIPAIPLIGGLMIGGIAIGYWLTFAGGVLLTLGCLLKDF